MSGGTIVDFNAFWNAFCGLIVGISIVMIFKNLQLPTVEQRHKIERKEMFDNLQKVFSDIKIGDLFSDVETKIKNCRVNEDYNMLSDGILTAEELLSNSIKMRTYIWQIDNSLIFETDNKAFIKIVFENDKLVSKEQIGLY